MDTLTRKPEMKKEINILVKICVIALGHIDFLCSLNQETGVKFLYFVLQFSYENEHFY